MTSQSPSDALTTIGQIAITVEDCKKSTAFYRDTLGLKHLFEAPPSMSFFECGPVRLMLSQPEKAGGERFSSVIYFKVADIQATHAALSARGVAFEGAPHLVAKLPDHELWMAFFRDPSRNLLALMCEQRKT